MKRALVLLLSATLLISSCQQPAQNDNRSANQNANGNTQPEGDIGAFSDHPQSVCESSGGANEKRVVITIAKAEVGGCRIESVVPDPLPDVVAQKHKIRWCVKNNCDITVQINLDNFRIESNPADNNPLGANSDLENNFLTGPIRPGRAGLKASEKASKSNLHPYKYDVKVFDFDDNLLQKMDPRVIISSTHLGDGPPANNGNANNGNANKNRR